MMEARAADFRLDTGLSEACASDIEDICGYERVSALNASWLAWLPCPATKAGQGCSSCHGS